MVVDPGRALTLIGDIMNPEPEATCPLIRYTMKQYNQAKRGMELTQVTETPITEG